MCDPVAQDCPEGEKCTAYSTDGDGPPAAPWNANKCVPVMGMGQAGDSCDIEGGKYTGVDDCDVGLICLQTDDDGKGGACVAFCEPGMTCEDPNAECAVYNDGSLPICLVTCDPLLQDCPQGQGCYAAAGGGAFICFKFSGMAGEGLQGDECNYVNACSPGTACLAPESVSGCGAQGGCCSPYCDLTDPNADAGCQQGEMCVSWFEMGMAPPGLEDVGVCAIPQ
ncbi:MAG: ribulose phosphate epimerase [Deltaproteobacteria bacterium]|nr:MAG: ribulose phosphate epimerase [Deltaproteobacteria bacterium]